MAVGRPTVPALGCARSGCTVARVAAAASLAGASALLGCGSDPTTVLQSDLPQVPGMTSRESSGIRQADGVIEAGTFAYKGAVINLTQRVAETKSRFTGMGWHLYSERLTPATATMVFSKDRRRASVEIIRNDVSPSMSTAVTTVNSTTPSPAEVPGPSGAPAGAIATPPGGA